jgi:hypothetical protein
MFAGVLIAITPSKRGARRGRSRRTVGADGEGQRSVADSWTASTTMGPPPRGPRLVLHFPPPRRVDLRIGPFLRPGESSGADFRASTEPSRRHPPLERPAAPDGAIVHEFPPPPPRPIARIHSDLPCDRPRNRLDVVDRWMRVE